MTQADKDRLEKAGSDPRNRFTMTMGGATSGAAGRAGGAPPGTPALGAASYPEFKPPFRGASAAAAPDGTLWVQRYGAANADPVYDGCDSQARLVKQVAMPRASRLVGLARTRCTSPRRVRMSSRRGCGTAGRSAPRGEARRLAGCGRAR